MNKIKAIKLTIQAIATVTGLVGIYWLWFCISIIPMFSDSTGFASLLIILSLLFALPAIWVAWSNIRRFSSGSIKWLVGYWAFYIHHLISKPIRPFTETLMDRLFETALAHKSIIPVELTLLACHVTPILIAVLIYLVVSRKLIKITKINSSNQQVDPIVKTPVD